MIYADTATGIEFRRKMSLRKWRLKCRAVADNLEEACDRLFSFTRLGPSQWKSTRTTNAIERLNEEFRCRIKSQAVLLWALLAAGQIQMRKVDDWETLSQPLEPGTWLRDLSGANFTSPDHAAREFPPNSRHDRGDPGGRINSSSPDRQLPDQRHSTLSHLALWFLSRPHAYLGHRCYRETGCRRF